MKVAVAPSARNDLLGILSYIAEENAAAADRVSERFEALFKLLGPNPNLGESCPQFGAGLRYTFVGVYVVFYEVDQAKGSLNVKAVVHGARDLPVELMKRGVM
jgi:toxin ParE1/3/4